MIPMLQQLRHSAAALLRTPGFSTAVLLLVGVAVAALLTIGTAVSALLWRPLPFPHADRLMAVSSHSTQMNASLGFAPGLLADLAAMPEVEAVGGYDWARPLFDAQGSEFRNARVQASLLELLGAVPLHGRLLRDDAADDDAVLLSETAWRARFAADPAVVGRTLDFDGTRVRVVGVLPAAFRFPERDMALWRALRFSSEQLTGARAFEFGAVQPLVRLARGVTPAAFDAALQARIGARPELEPMQRFMGLELRAATLRSQWEGGRGELLALLAVAATAVLLLLVANVASLWLTRCLERGRELAVRSALGATSVRLTWELVGEVVLLTGAAVLAGLLGVVPGLRALEWLGVLDAAAPMLPALDATSAVFAFAIAIALTVLLSLVPAWIARQPRMIGLLAQGARGTPGRGAQRTRRALVALQLALAVSLVGGAGLLVRSLWQVLEQDPGFTPQGVSLLLIEDRDAAAAAGAAVRLDAVRQRLASLPGVSAVSFANAPPFSRSESVSSVTIPGGQGDAEATVRGRVVGPGYFAALGMPLRAGRDFLSSDTSGGEAAVIVDERFVERHLAGREALGAALRIPTGRDGNDSLAARVVGVVPTVRHVQLEEEPELGTVYRYVAQPAYEAGRTTLVLRSDLPLADLGRQARDAARDAGLRVVEAATLVERMRESLADRMPLLGLVGAFALLGAALSAFGLFALVAYAVQRRAAEFGLRLALGAPPASLRGLALAEGWRAAGPGLALGLLGALVVGRALASRLYQVSAWDPLTLGIVLSIATALVVLACLGPARRAAALDPLATLRHE
jgi:putative ABC transport system permease protein